MPKCEECGNQYISKECPTCNPRNRIHLRDTVLKNNDAITIKKSHILFVIAGALSVIALVMVYKEYKEYRQEQEIKEAMQAIGKELEPYNETMKESLKNMNEMNKKLMRDLNK